MWTHTSRLGEDGNDNWSAEQEELLRPVRARGPVLNVYRALIRYPAALKAFQVWGGHILTNSTLSARLRELVVLRTAFLCRSGYEWGHHALIGRREGLSEAEIERVKAGPQAPDWTEPDRCALALVDDLQRDCFVSDHTWAHLQQNYEERQIMDLIFTVGHYTQAAMILNSLGVQLEPGVTLEPELDARRPADTTRA